MTWFALLVLAAGAFAVLRIYFSLRKLRNSREQDWDSRAIERLRKLGSDPFSPHDVDFFFALPDEAGGRTVAALLESEGFTVDLRPVPDSTTHPFSVHALKSMRLSASDMREMSKRFTALATANGGRYDGWTAPLAGRHS